MKKITKSLILLAFALSFGLIVGIVIVLVVFSPTNGPVFYSMAAPQVGVAVDHNLTIVDVLVGSPAEKSGIKRGDVLKKVGGLDLTPGDDVKKAAEREINAVTKEVKGANGYETMEVQALPIVINRGGNRLTISIKAASPPFNYNKNYLPLPTPAPNDLAYL